MSVRFLNLPARPRLFRLLFVFLSLLALCLFAASCGAPRVSPVVPLDETTIWRGHPSIVICHDRATMLAHCPDFLALNCTVLGRWEPKDDTVYILGRGDTLTGAQGLYLAHELQHVADDRHHGNLGGVLRDESGTLAGDANFDTHGWGADARREHAP